MEKFYNIWIWFQDIDMKKKSQETNVVICA